MSPKAHLSQTEALDRFRSALIRYREKALAVAGEPGFEARRVRFWLQETQKRHWTRQARIRSRKVEMARHALWGPGVSGSRGSEPRLALKRAQRELEAAEEKLRRVAHWIRRFPPDAEPLVREVENMETQLAHLLGKGVARLERLIEVLEGYSAAS